MEFYNQNCFDKKVWILDNLEKLNINIEEILLILLIDHCNNYNIFICNDYLSSKLKLSKSQVDLLIQSLIDKGYLEVGSNEKGLTFDISAIFDIKDVANESLSLIDAFHECFKRELTKKEMDKLEMFIDKYDINLIKLALKDCVVAEDVSFKRIDKLLVFWEKQGETYDSLSSK